MFVFSFHKEIDLVRYAGPNNQTKGNIWEIDRLQHFYNNNDNFRINLTEFALGS